MRNGCFRTFHLRPKVGAFKCNFLVKDGIVTLRGEATSQAQIDLTTEYIRDVEGVKDVKNDMTVSEAHRTPAEKTMGEKAGDVGKKIGNTASDVGEWIDDASITALVKATLLYHRSTSALNTKVETIEGVVNLGGTARNASEKDLATKFVQDVHGVKSVNNQMTIE
jgi:hyperosmotically inducible protein